MKNNHAFVSLLVAFASLATGCAESSSIENAPIETRVVGNLATPNTDTPKSITSRAKRSAPAQSVLFPRQATPFGTTYEEYAAEWWQWAMAIPRSENPILGGPCELNQSGEVFFLAGTNGANTVRSCTMPVGKGIFFPLVNVEYVSCPEFGGLYDYYSCEDSMNTDLLHEWASQWVGVDHTLLLEVDGVRVDNLDEYRAASEAYSETSPADFDQMAYPSPCNGPIRENQCARLECLYRRRSRRIRA